MLAMSDKFSYPTDPPIKPTTCNPSQLIQPTLISLSQPSFQEEIIQTSNMNFRRALSQPVQVSSCPEPSQPSAPRPIRMQTLTDVRREASSNIGIWNISDTNICRLFRCPDAHRFSSDEGFRGEKFARARNMFVKFSSPNSSNSNSMRSG